MRDASEAGFTEFVRASSTALLRTAVLLAGGDRGHAEDLVQGVLERMYVRWDRIEGPPEAYARRALAHAAVNRWRTRGRRPELPLLTEDLRAALHSYTAEVSAPDLTSAVRRGAVRRRRRHRFTVIAAPVAAIGVIAATVLFAPRPGAVADSLTAADQQLLDRPTGGDLAGDQPFVTAATTAWDRSHRGSDNAVRGIFDHLLGRPTVIWAGTTPAGRAAFVVQAANLRQHADVSLEREGPALLWGFVGPGAGGDPVVVADGFPVAGGPDLQAAFLGADRDVLLVAERDAPAQVSWGITYGPGGRATRNWKPVRFTDGVGVVSRPSAALPTAARLRIDTKPADIGNTEADGSATQQAGDSRLQWMDGAGRPVFPVGTRTGAAWPGGRLPDEATADTALTDVLEPLLAPVTRDAHAEGNSLWFAAGSTPDGSRLVAGEHTLDDDPSRVYAVLLRPGRTARVGSALVNRDPAVPVMVRLPDGQGWLVAAKGGDFSWVVGGNRDGLPGGTTYSARDAALIPVGAEVFLDGTPVTLS